MVNRGKTKVNVKTYKVTKVKVEVKVLLLSVKIVEVF